MRSYKNDTGSSGVTAYQIGDEEIVVQFVDGQTYLYNYAKPGKNKVEQMKALALDGNGLTTFINQHVREQYAEKLNNS